MTISKENCNFIIKQPNECSEYELNKFHELVLKGAKNQTEGLRERIENAKLLGFAIHNNEIIAISAIKQPQESYVRGVIEKAKLERNWQELKFEIGYSYTEKDYREKGISKEIKKKTYRKDERR